MNFVAAKRATGNFLIDQICSISDERSSGTGFCEMKGMQTEFGMSVAVCAWCEPRARGSSPGALSHGICPRHLRKFKLEASGVVIKSRPRHRRNLAQEILLPLG
ncbi:MAG TPA: hypothetical protein VG146_16105 [Verrucomicrobiae bacterium]|nr:hypothetical protein [Verrucomicrobiae bacterium]